MDIHHCGKYQQHPGGCRKRRYVQDKSYILSYAKIVGYGRPGFFTIKGEAEVTQEQFDKMMDNWLERRGEKAPAGWSESEHQWAEENGIIHGDGSGKKMYKAFATREHMIVFLYRLAEKLGLVK